MLERSVACPDFEFVAFITSRPELSGSCLLCIIGATCQSGCGLCRICVDSAITTAKLSKVRTLATHSFVKRSTLCRRLVRGGWCEQTGTIASLLLRKDGLSPFAKKLS